MNRRDFIGGCLFSASLIQTRGVFAESPAATYAGHSLIPVEPSVAPNYWCTWAAQNYVYGQGAASLDPRALEGDSGSKLAHNAMCEKVVFAADGWAHRFHPRVRKELYLLLDDGWEAGGMASFELDEIKFPSFKGAPAERLRKLNRAAEEAGWRGAALWCRNTPGGEEDLRLEELSAEAGIRYWKIDIGDPSFHLVRLRNEHRLDLALEHVHGEGPLNGDWKNAGRFGSQPWGSRRVESLRQTDVYRTYDVTSILSVPTTLDRLAEMLRGAEGHAEVQALLNVEDEVYVAAAMGCTMGVMRHPMTGLRPSGDPDLFFNGPRHAKKRMDEVTRAIRWQRIAAPFAPGTGSYHASEEILTDSWIFEKGQTWMGDLPGKTVHQGAPAVMTRNLALPTVKAAGEKPFVQASRFPNGAVALAVHERTQSGHAWYMPKCEIALDAADAPGPFAFFGAPEQITLTSALPLAGKRILAQDLAADKPLDITDRVRIVGQSIYIAGSLVRKIGLSGATSGDESAPAMVMAIVNAVH